MIPADLLPTITAARAAAAALSPEHLVDTLGREHECIPRRAILAGQWDDGSLVRDFLSKLDDVKGVGEP